MTAARALPVRLPGEPIYWVLALAVLASAVAIEDFRTAENVTNLVRQAAVLGILAVGQVFVVVAGLIDLSIGMIVGLVVVVACDLMAGETINVPVAVAAALAIGAAVGLANGVLNNVLRIHPLILTFGMLSILQGIIFVYTDRSVGLAAPEIVWLANGSLLGVPTAGIVLFLVAVAGHLAMTRTRFGKHVQATGGAPESARRAGIAVRRIHLLVFLISGLTAALAGLMMAGRLGTGYPNAGVNLELDALAAVVLGGAVLGGGRGTVGGAMAAVFVLAIASNALNLLEVSAYVQMLLKGLIVIGAILINQPRRRMAVA